ncbi:hypothetical protein QYE76_019556 [Lolium multiflorum]|uniref:Reverse transcriptase Ty1/copia-type domain-containing protein n=1 Tax=Lolium multiflorum TaxID=4521 RepID=A0AAD8R6R1_LOLMU|nr:hypothetical protein QYE76_019556 [Lolium multiflorum]
MAGSKNKDFQFQHCFDILQHLPKWKLRDNEPKCKKEALLTMDDEAEDMSGRNTGKPEGNKKAKERVKVEQEAASFREKLDQLMKSKEALTMKTLETKLLITDKKSVVKLAKVQARKELDIKMIAAKEAKAMKELLAEEREIMMMDGMDEDQLAWWKETNADIIARKKAARQARDQDLRVFGCTAYAHVDNGKLEPRAVKCIFLGYGSGVKAYRLWNPETKKIHRIGVQVEHAKENEFVVPETNNDDNDVPPSPPFVQRQGRSIAADRPRRNIAPPTRLIQECDIVDYALSCAEQVEHDIEPATYTEAIASVDKEKWVGAMQEEMQSLEKNGTWDVVHLPKQKKAVRKWIFKRKEGLSPNEPPRFKASSIRAFFGIVAMHDLELEQLDVKTAFLHGELEEEIYMDQPEGYVVPDAIKVGSGKVDVALLAEEGLVEEGGDGVVVAAGQIFNHARIPWHQRRISSRVGASIIHIFRIPVPLEDEERSPGGGVEAADRSDIGGGCDSLARDGASVDLRGAAHAAGELIQELRPRWAFILSWPMGALSQGLRSMEVEGLAAIVALEASRVRSCARELNAARGRFPSSRGSTTALLRVVISNRHRPPPPFAASSDGEEPRVFARAPPSGSLLDAGEGRLLVVGKHGAAAILPASSSSQLGRRCGPTAPVVVRIK